MEGTSSNFVVVLVYVMILSLLDQTMILFPKQRLFFINIKLKEIGDPKFFLGLELSMLKEGNIYVSKVL